MKENLGSFDRIPFAAASIGQCLAHGKTGTCRCKNTVPERRGFHRKRLGYVKTLLTVGSILPNGLFLDRTIQQ